MKTTHEKNIPQTEPFPWLRYLLFPTLGIALYPAFVLGVGGDHWAVRLSWVLFLGFCWFCSGGSFHEMCHQNLFRKKESNIWVGRFFGTIMGLPYSLFKEAHRQHHACMNKPNDPEMWPYCDPQYSLTFRRCFLLIHIPAAFFVFPYIIGRVLNNERYSIKEETRKTIKKEYLGIHLFWGTLIAGSMIIARLNGYRIWDFDPLWILPLALSQTLNVLRQMIEHMGMTSCDPLLGTRTVISNNYISRVLCYFNFESAVHGPHHRFPKSQHFQLVDQYDNHLEKNPELQPPIFGSYFAAFLDMLPHLWNPRIGPRSEELKQIEFPADEKNDLYKDKVA